MGNPWYETFCLVVSNFPIFFALLSISLRVRVKIVAFTLFAICGCASIIYHLCQSGDVCFGQALIVLRMLDHVSVWAIGFWVLLRAARLPPPVTVALEFVALFVFIMFYNFLIATILFPLTCGAFFIVLYILRPMYFHIPLHHFGLFFFAWALFFIGSGLFLFFLADDIYSPDFWIYHSVWHVLSETGLWLLYEAVSGTRILNLIGLGWVYDMTYFYIEEIFEWEINTFDARKKRVIMDFP